jgi:hypothetical protein
VICSLRASSAPSCGRKLVDIINFRLNWGWTATCRIKKAHACAKAVKRDTFQKGWVWKCEFLTQWRVYADCAIWFQAGLWVELMTRILHSLAWFCNWHESLGASPPRALNCLYYSNPRIFRVWIETGSPPVTSKSKDCSKFLQMEQSLSIIIYLKQNNANPSDLDALCSEQIARKQCVLG